VINFLAVSSIVVDSKLGSVVVSGSGVGSAAIVSPVVDPSRSVVVSITSVVVGSAVDPCGVVVSGSGVVGFSLVPPFVDPSGSVVVSITSVVTVEGASVDVGSAVDPCGVVVGGSDVGGSVEVGGTGVGD